MSKENTTKSKKEFLNLFNPILDGVRGTLYWTGGGTKKPPPG